MVGANDVVRVAFRRPPAHESVLGNIAGISNPVPVRINLTSVLDERAIVRGIRCAVVVVISRSYRATIRTDGLACRRAEAAVDGVGHAIAIAIQRTRVVITNDVARAVVATD